MNVDRLASLAVLSLSLTVFSGCKSAADKALDQAKQQAVATGQPQQIVSVAKDGTTTTVVQPPRPGQANQVITTTTTHTSASPVTQQPVVTQQPGVAPAGGEAIAAGTQAGNAPASSAAAFAQPVTGGAPAVQPVPGGAPVVQPVDVSLPAGTSLTIRINQHISVKTSHAGERFSGEVAEPVADGNGQTIVPRGTPVGGVIDASHRRGHFKGRSILELRLTSISLNGREYPIETRDLTRTKKGKGKRSAAFIGGGVGLGMLVGGVASGGVGLLAGGLAGGGAGTAIAGLTGNRDIEIPAESIVRFRLADDLVVQP